MDQTPTPTPHRGLKSRRPTFSLELVLAGILTIAVAAGLIVAGGSGRILEVAVLLVAAVVAAFAGWPLSGRVALGAAVAYLILEAVFGRLDSSHAITQLLLTVGIVGSVLAAGFAQSAGATEGLRHKRPRWKRSAPEPATAGTWADDPPADEPPGARRLTAGTLEYEIERARECERPLSVLTVRPDDLDSLAAAGDEQLTRLLDLLDEEIEGTVRAIDVVGRQDRARFQVILPETGPEGARSVAERIRLRIDSTRPELSLGTPVDVSYSIGVATYPEDGTDEVELDAAAERALTRAAELGGNRTVLHSVPAGVPPGWGLSAAGGTRPLQQQH